VRTEFASFLIINFQNLYIISTRQVGRLRYLGCAVRVVHDGRLATGGGVETQSHHPTINDSIS